MAINFKSSKWGPGMTQEKYYKIKARVKAAAKRSAAMVNATNNAARAAYDAAAPGNKAAAYLASRGVYE